VVVSGAAHHATRDSRVGTASLYCSKGYPCFRVPTVAPGPTSGEDTSLQVGLKLDWRLARRFHAFADAITASPSSVTPTATFVPAADWPMPPTLDGFAGPRAGCLDTAALVLKIHLLCLLRQPRGDAILARAAVRLLRTRRPTPKEYDSWAWAPVSETGPLFSAEMKRRTTASGGSLLAWRFASFALGDPHTSCMTCGPGPPCHRLGHIGARRARFFAASRGTSRRVFLEKGFTPRAAVTLSHSLHSLRPFAFELSAPLCIRVLLLHTYAAVDAMTSLGQPDRFQTEATLDVVRHLLGWGAPALAERIRAGAVPLGDLAAGEFVLFTSYISCGLALPISPFFLLLLEEFSLQLQHLTPHSILQAAIFAHLCEMFVGVAPCTSLFRHFFVLVKSGKAKDHLGAYYFQTRPDSAGAYIPSLSDARWEN
jgi:hypothetical protein